MPVVHGLAPHAGRCGLAWVALRPDTAVKRVGSFWRRRPTSCRASKAIRWCHTSHLTRAAIVEVAPATRSGRGIVVVHHTASPVKSRQVAVVGVVIAAAHWRAVLNRRHTFDLIQAIVAPKRCLRHPPRCPANSTASPSGQKSRVPPPKSGSGCCAWFGF